MAPVHLLTPTPCFACSVQTAELRRRQAERATQQAEVSKVEAEEADITARNTALNKQSAALQAEVRGHGAHAACSALLMQL